MYSLNWQYIPPNKGTRKPHWSICETEAMTSTKSCGGSTKSMRIHQIWSTISREEPFLSSPTFPIAFTGPPKKMVKKKLKPSAWRKNCFRIYRDSLVWPIFSTQHHILGRAEIDLKQKHPKKPFNPKKPSPLDLPSGFELKKTESSHPQET